MTGSQATGTPFTSMTALVKRTLCLAWSYTTRSALTCHSGVRWPCLLAYPAGRIDRAVGDHPVVDAFGAARRQPSILADQGAEAAQHAVAHVIGEHDMIGEGDIASRVGQC